MDAVKEFAVALAEVDSLITLSKREDTPERDRLVLLKASILLLTTKVECLFESLIEEYCDRVCTRESAAHLPIAIRVSASRKIFMDGKLDTESQEPEVFASKMKAITAIWSDKGPCPQVYVDNKFAYGKHGEQQVTKLFRRIGIKNVFEEFPVEDDTESLAAVTGPTSIAPDFNSLSNIRNNITHSDATPPLTDADIERHKRRLLRFAERLDAHLEGTLSQDPTCTVYHI